MSPPRDRSIRSATAFEATSPSPIRNAPSQAARQKRRKDLSHLLGIDQIRSVQSSIASSASSAAVVQQPRQGLFSPFGSRARSRGQRNIDSAFEPKSSELTKSLTQTIASSCETPSAKLDAGDDAVLDSRGTLHEEKERKLAVPQDKYTSSPKRSHDGEDEKHDQLDDLIDLNAERAPRRRKNLTSYFGTNDPRFAKHTDQSGAGPREGSSRQGKADADATPNEFERPMHTPESPSEADPLSTKRHRKNLASILGLDSAARSVNVSRAGRIGSQTSSGHASSSAAEYRNDSRRAAQPGLDSIDSQLSAEDAESPGLSPSTSAQSRRPRFVPCSPDPECLESGNASFDSDIPLDSRLRTKNLVEHLGIDRASGPSKDSRVVVLSEDTDDPELQRALTIIHKYMSASAEEEPGTQLKAYLKAVKKVRKVLSSAKIKLQRTIRAPGQSRPWSMSGLRHRRKDVSDPGVNSFVDSVERRLELEERMQRQSEIERKFHETVRFLALEPVVVPKAGSELSRTNTAFPFDACIVSDGSAGLLQSDGRKPASRTRSDGTKASRNAKGAPTQGKAFNNYYELESSNDADDAHSLCDEGLQEAGESGGGDYGGDQEPDAVYSTSKYRVIDLVRSSNLTWDDLVHDARRFAQQIQAGESEATLAYLSPRGSLSIPVPELRRPSQMSRRSQLRPSTSLAEPDTKRLSSNSPTRPSTDAARRTSSPSRASETPIGPISSDRNAVQQQAVPATGGAPKPAHADDSEPQPKPSKVANAPFEPGVDVDAILERILGDESFKRTLIGIHLFNQEAHPDLFGECEDGPLLPERQERGAELDSEYSDSDGESRNDGDACSVNSFSYQGPSWHNFSHFARPISRCRAISETGSYDNADNDRASFVNLSPRGMRRPASSIRENECEDPDPPTRYLGPHDFDKGNDSDDEMDHPLRRSNSELCDLFELELLFEQHRRNNRKRIGQPGSSIAGSRHSNLSALATLADRNTLSSLNSSTVQLSAAAQLEAVNATAEEYMRQSALGPQRTSAFSGRLLPGNQRQRSATSTSNSSAIGGKPRFGTFGRSRNAPPSSVASPASAFKKLEAKRQRAKAGMKSIDNFLKAESSAIAPDTVPERTWDEFAGVTNLSSTAEFRSLIGFIFGDGTNNGDADSVSAAGLNDTDVEWRARRSGGKMHGDALVDGLGADEMVTFGDSSQQNDGEYTYEELWPSSEEAERACQDIDSGSSLADDPTLREDVEQAVSEAIETSLPRRI
ncbi:hypothetical protein HK105_204626 [Polyrhizophydium stewartii]|uniref:Uncharacterized protein n=1 Tax=Polyrhizophydium stewartii TaxID=2732419 RepID=A0ABR4N8Q9_9FUNG